MRHLVFTSVHRCNYIFYQDLYDPLVMGGNVPYDIAVISLRGDIDLSLPYNDKIELCPPSINHSEGVAIGLGMSRKNLDQSFGVLTGVKLVRDDKYGKYLGNMEIDIDDDVQVCYASKVPGVYNGPCFYDNGGPCFTNMDMKCVSLALPVFFPADCKNPDLPAVFTKAQFFTKWIQLLLEEYSFQVTWTKFRLPIWYWYAVLHNQNCSKRNTTDGKIQNGLQIPNLYFINTVVIDFDI